MQEMSCWSELLSQVLEITTGNFFLVFQVVSQMNDDTSLTSIVKFRVLREKVERWLMVSAVIAWLLHATLLCLCLDTIGRQAEKVKK
jgi:hypothetical protein